MSSCASNVSCTPDVIGDVTSTQSRSNFEIDISPSIFQLESRSELKMSGMLVAILLVYSTSGVTSGKKSLLRPQNGGHSENFIKWNAASFWPQMWKEMMPNDAKKVFSWWWRHRWRYRVASKSALYIHDGLGEARSGSKWQGQSLVNTCMRIYRNGLSILYMPKEDLNKRQHFSEIASPRSTSQAYWVTLVFKWP